MRLYFIVHGFWPDSDQSYVDQVRPRPAILGACQLPERMEEKVVKVQRISIAREHGINVAGGGRVINLVTDPKADSTH